MAEEQRQRLEANVRAQSDRYQTGNAERGALNMARVLEQEVTPRIEESRRISSGALLKLAQTMGDDLGRRELPAAEGELRYVRGSISMSRARPLPRSQQRADLKLARLLVRAAEEDQRIIAAALLPRASTPAWAAITFRSPKFAAAAKARRGAPTTSSPRKCRERRDFHLARGR